MVARTLHRYQRGQSAWPSRSPILMEIRRLFPAP